jgi:hypothetical protein
MNLIFFIIFILTICIIIFFLTRKSHSNNSVIIKDKEKYKMSLLNNIGNLIQKKNNIQITNTSNRQNKIKLNNSLDILKEQIINIIIAKYDITDDHIIDYIKNSCLDVLLKLSQQKSIENILNHYNPQQSNDLIILVLRNLFYYPSLDVKRKILIGQYLINKSNNENEIENIYDYISSIALNKNENSVTRMNASDILNLSNNSRYMKISKNSLELLRQEDDLPKVINSPHLQNMRNIFDNVQVLNPFNTIRNNIINDIPIIAPIIIRDNVRYIPNNLRQNTKERSIYNDGQNVHNTEINNSVLEAGKNLIKNYTTSSILTFNYNLISNLPEDKKMKIEAALHRILTDDTIFKYNITLYTLFQSLLYFIEKHPNKDELNKRLIEELISSSGLCASGHISRLINTLQGYDISNDLKIKIKIDDEIYAKIKHFIDKSLQNAVDNDEIMDDMMTNNKSIFITFIKTIIYKELPTIYNEYKDIATKDEISKVIISSLDKYSNTINNFELI